MWFKRQRVRASSNNNIKPIAVTVCIIQSYCLVIWKHCLLAKSYRHIPFIRFKATSYYCESEYSFIRMSLSWCAPVLTLHVHVAQQRAVTVRGNVESGLGCPCAFWCANLGDRAVLNNCCRCYFHPQPHKSLSAYKLLIIAYHSSMAKLLDQVVLFFNSIRLG